ncbi:hypothetical protein BDN72DRAFT_959389 [Pluteus cervinus]|uniref:Uncharacterized protein n=1 Tax=Pluteus cervinus TaxID=181527 RepID=A0ACD3AVH2_9AGAR|nr:hypothetical protein BDN72DRAFT_959389 [Pluteus cervinus]
MFKVPGHRRMWLVMPSMYHARVVVVGCYDVDLALTTLAVLPPIALWLVVIPSLNLAQSAGCSPSCANEPRVITTASLFTRIYPSQTLADVGVWKNGVGDALYMLMCRGGSMWMNLTRPAQWHEVVDMGERRRTWNEPTKRTRKPRRRQRDTCSHVEGILERPSQPLAKSTGWRIQPLRIRCVSMKPRRAKPTRTTAGLCTPFPLASIACPSLPLGHRNVKRLDHETMHFIFHLYINNGHYQTNLKLQTIHESF